MTIEEMHIAVNLGVQKIASFQVDNLLPQEIDHELNDAMFSFIKQRYSPGGNKYRDGFEQSQKRIDDLRALVVEARLKCFYYGPSITGFFVDRAPLPNDYMFLVNAYHDGFYDCTQTVTPQTSTYTYSVGKLSLTPPTEGYILLSVNVNGTPIIQVSADALAASIGLETQDLIDGNNYASDLISDIAIVASDPDYPTDNSSLFPTYDINSLVSHEVTPTAHSNEITYLFTGPLVTGTLTGVWYNPLGGDNPYTEVDFTLPATSQVTYRAYDGTSAVPGTNQRAKMSYSQHDDILSLLGDPFNTSTYDSIKYTMEENFIDVYSDNSFFTTFVNIKYIRQPKLMSNALGIGCELAPHTHQEIVEMTVQSILEAISDPRYNSQSREVLGSE